MFKSEYEDLVFFTNPNVTRNKIIQEELQHYYVSFLILNSKIMDFIVKVIFSRNSQYANNMIALY